MARNVVDVSAGAPTAPGTVPVAIYARVSTEGQVGGRFDSCESQAAICRETIRRRANQGWFEVACFTDAAYSGGNMNRPGIQELKRQIAAGRIKVVLIFKLERVLRSTVEWSPFRAFLQQHGCRIESATEELSEETPSGRLKNNMLVSVSEYERENTVEKTLAKMHELAKKGMWNGGPVPFGYTYDLQEQKLSPHPHEGVLVQKIFREAGQLVSLTSIAEDLNGEGHRTKERVFNRRDGTRQVVGGKRFRADALRLLIANPLYRGVIKFVGREYPGQHEALVTTEEWERANAAVRQALKPEPVGFRPEQDKHFHLLKGLLVCGCCGHAMIPHASGKKDPNGKLYRYYDCSNVLKERADAPCRVRRLAAGPLEQVVVQFLAEVGKHPDVLRAATGSSRNPQDEQVRKLGTHLDALDRDLTQVNRSLRNCVEAISAGGLDELGAELREEVAMLRERKQILLVAHTQATQELAASRRKALDEKQVLAAVGRFGEVLAGLSPEEQKTLVGLFVEEIHIHPSRAVSDPVIAYGPRRLELRFKMTIPRFVEGMEKQMVVDSGAKEDTRRLTIAAEVLLKPATSSEKSSVLAPFRSGVVIVRSLGQGIRKPAPVRVHGSETGRCHPLLRALGWRDELDRDTLLSLRQIARREGVTAPVVSQHMKLLRLAPEIRSYLAGVRDPAAVVFFSLRKLIRMSALPEAGQLGQFREMKNEFESRPGSQVVNKPADDSTTPRSPRRAGSAASKVSVQGQGAEQSSPQSLSANQKTGPRTAAAVFNDSTQRPAPVTLPAILTATEGLNAKSLAAHSFRAWPPP